MTNNFWAMNAGKLAKPREFGDLLRQVNWIGEGTDSIEMGQRSGAAELIQAVGDGKHCGFLFMARLCQRLYAQFRRRIEDWEVCSDEIG